MFKNVSSQRIALRANNYVTGAPFTGDAANVTFFVNKDWAGSNAISAGSVQEISSTKAPGWYSGNLTQVETNADALLFTGNSSVANISVSGLLVFTDPQNYTSLTISVTGNTTVGTVNDKSGYSLSSSQTFNNTGTQTGNITGNLTGNIIGNFTGTQTGNITGNITGNLLGNVSGNLTGNITGNVSGNFSSTVIATEVIGNVFGSVIGGRPKELRPGRRAKGSH